MLIDTHAHLMFKEFDGDFEDVLSKAKEAGVVKIIDIGCDLKSSEDAISLSGKYENLYATVGLHPYDAALATEELMEGWEKIILENKKIVAVGECGLDYFKAQVPKEIQKNAFRLQIDLAKKASVPLIVHCRDAYEDTLEILDEEFGWNGENCDAGLSVLSVDESVKSDGLIGGGYFGRIVFHCYSGTLEFAEKLWKRGIITSFTGIVTYPNAKDLHEVVKNVPMNLFMVETDCPYLAPQKYRGERNEPAYVVEVAKKIAELKDLPFEEVMKISYENSLEFFRFVE